MAAKLAIGKRLGEMAKAGCRWACQPIVPLLPDSLANRLPFLGRVCVHGPHGLRLRLHSYGPRGKDRIALKLARRGLAGYEEETTRVFLELARHAQTIIDIGANTGLFALLAAKSQPRCRVIAFEPVPFIFDMLARNVRLNELNNVQTIPLAVGDFVGETAFYVTNTHVGVPTDSSACRGFRNDVNELRLSATTLDAYLAHHPVDRLDLIKIDAEATELQVIRGAQEMLANHRPLVICEVLADVDQSELQAIFQSLNYRFYHIGPNGLEARDALHGSLAVDQRNHLLVPAEKVGNLSLAASR